MFTAIYNGPQRPKENLLNGDLLTVMGLANDPQFVLAINEETGTAMAIRGFEIGPALGGSAPSVPGFAGCAVRERPEMVEHFATPSPGADAVLNGLDATTDGIDGGLGDGCQTPPRGCPVPGTGRRALRHVPEGRKAPGGRRGQGELGGFGSCRRRPLVLERWSVPIAAGAVHATLGGVWSGSTRLL